MTKHFHDRAGETVALVRNMNTMRKADATARWPGTKFKAADSFSVWVMDTIDGETLPVTREVRYAVRPSKHKCDARCVHATGLIMNCQCSCGGKNHGKGS